MVVKMAQLAYFQSSSIERKMAQIMVVKTKALFGWAFGFGFWPQKPKVQPKGLLLEGAFSEAAAFP